MTSQCRQPQASQPNRKSGASFDRPQRVYPTRIQRLVLSRRLNCLLQAHGGMRSYDATTSTRSRLGRTALMMFRADHHRDARTPEAAQNLELFRVDSSLNASDGIGSTASFFAWPCPGPSALLSAWFFVLPPEYLPPHKTTVCCCIQRLLRLLPLAPTSCTSHWLKRRERDKRCEEEHFWARVNVITINP